MEATKNNRTELVNVVSNIKVGGAKFSLTTATEPKFIGGKSNPYTGHVVKVTRYITAFNGDYVTNLANTATRNGATSEEIESATADVKPSPYNHKEGALFELKSNPDKLYCRLVQKRADQEGNTTHWFLDGVEVTDPAKIDDIKANLYKSKPSNVRLDNLGIESEEQCAYKFVSLDSIRRIKQGDKVWEMGEY